MHYLASLGTALPFTGNSALHKAVFFVFFLYFIRWSSLAHSQVPQLYARPILSVMYWAAAIYSGGKKQILGHPSAISSHASDFIHRFDKKRMFRIATASSVAGYWSCWWHQSCVQVQAMGRCHWFAHFTNESLFRRWVPLFLNWMLLQK